MNIIQSIFGNKLEMTKEEKERKKLAINTFLDDSHPLSYFVDQTLFDLDNDYVIVNQDKIINKIHEFAVKISFDAQTLDEFSKFDSHDKDLNKVVHALANLLTCSIRLSITQPQLIQLLKCIGCAATIVKDMWFNMEFRPELYDEIVQKIENEIAVCNNILGNIDTKN